MYSRSLIVLFAIKKFYIDIALKQLIKQSKNLIMKKRPPVFLLSLLASFNLTAQNWLTAGNALGANGTLGTTTNFSVLFKSNNSERGRLTNSGLWGFGTTAPNSKVHINSAAGVNAFRAQVNGSTKLLVHSGGGVSVGSSSTPPANGLYVSGNTGIRSK